MTATPTHQPCTSFAEDIALLAGDDLASEKRSREVQEHLDACFGCRDLHAELAGQGSALASLGLSAQAPAGFADGVIARVRLETGLRGASAAPTHRLPRLGAPPSLWVAATIAVAMLAGALAVDRLTGGVEGGGLARIASPGSAGVEAEPVALSTLASARLPSVGSMSPEIDDSLPVRVKRAPAGVELTWDADGRETRPDGTASTYRMVASASPRDFSGARPVEVAGRMVVATHELPVVRKGDRSLTFFRVY